MEVNANSQDHKEKEKTMAASISGYPHIEMHVRDDSIYIPRSEEILPLNKPLYMMKTYRGPVGVPVWCPTYTDAVRVFGADTFNKRSKYFSENAYYLLKTFPFNGAFIMRVASETAEDSRISIEVGLSLEASRVKLTDPETGKQYYGGFNTEAPIVPQYKRDSNGNFVLELTGAKIPINEAGKSPEEWVEEGESIDTWSQAMLPGYKVAWRAVCRGAEDKRELGSAMTTEAGGYTWYPMLDIEATNPGVWGRAYGIKLYFDHTINTLSGIITNGSTTVSLAPVEFLQDATVATPITDAYGQTCTTGVMKPDVVDADTEVDLTLEKRVKRAYSGNQTLPLKFYYITDNWNAVGKELMMAELAARDKAHEFYPMLDTVLTGTMKAGTFTETSDSTRDESKDYYIQVPGDPVTYRKAVASDFESDGSFTSGTHYFEPDPDVASYGVKTFVDELFQLKKTVSSEVDSSAGAVTEIEDIIDADSIGGDESDVGYMVNPLSCCNYNGIPYFGSIIVESTDETIVDENGDPIDDKVNPKDIIIPSSDQSIFLAGGHDGGVDGVPYDYEVEEYIRAQIRATIAQTQDYLNDYWHCPFNAVYDTGYSLKTKKAIIDMTAVRDNMVAVIGSQITWQKGKTYVAPVANSRMDDEAIAASLRAYALLMKEDVENATGACRTVIFTNAGKTSDHDDKWLPFTLWYALKNAEYLNKPFIDQEPKELPYSAVECFTEWNWTAAQEDTKARIWNSGVNYVQHYDMTSIHFASVRSVYWYETSILVDAGAVNALCFMKDVARRSWSTWAGSTRRAAELNKKITEDLDARLAYMLHDKFRHKVNVYQTEEDMNLGFQRHVDLELWAAGQNRVWKTTIICKREGYNDRIDNA